jgi:hypothetical protein
MGHFLLFHCVLINAMIFELIYLSLVEFEIMIIRINGNSYLKNLNTNSLTEFKIQS